MKDVLGLTADYAAQFLASLDERPVRASATVEELREALGGPLPEEPSPPEHVLSVSNWQTSERDVERSAAAILEAAAAVSGALR